MKNTLLHPFNPDINGITTIFVIIFSFFINTSNADVELQHPKYVHVNEDIDADSNKITRNTEQESIATGYNESEPDTDDEPDVSSIKSDGDREVDGTVSNEVNVDNEIDSHNEIAINDDAEENSVLLKSHKAFKKINDDSFNYFESLYDSNKYKFSHEDILLNEQAISLYNDMTAFFTENNEQFIRLLNDGKLENKKLYEQFNLILKQHEISTIEELHAIIMDFSFSIQIDDMLFAFPITRKTQLKNTHINISSIKIDESILADLPSDTDLFSENDFTQTFAVYNSDHESIFEAHIIIRDENLSGNKNTTTMSTKDLLTTRFKKLPSSSQFVDAYWLYEKEKGALYATKIQHYKHIKNSLFGKSFYHINNALEGVFYGGKTEDKIVNNYVSIFSFDSTLPVTKNISSGKFCYANNKTSRSILVNKRTNMTSSASYGVSHCIEARPGDIIALYKYPIFRPKVPTCLYLAFNRNNTLNRFYSSSIKTANLGKSLK